MNKESYFITGIGTGVGKTLISCILSEYLQADYWKPIQAGDLDNTDSKFVQDRLSNNKSIIHPECYRLKNALSPHAAAELEDIEIELNKFNLPQTNNSLIVEGAGGLFVPINQKEFIIDLIIKLNLPVILVSQNYLGSINHTLMSLDVLKYHGVKVKGLIFNGASNPASESIILKHTDVPLIGSIPIMESTSKGDIISVSSFLSKDL